MRRQAAVIASCPGQLFLRAGREGSETFKKAGMGGWVRRQNKLMETAREESEKS